jgi:hypothetical protein
VISEEAVRVLPSLSLVVRERIVVFINQDNASSLREEGNNKLRNIDRVEKITQEKYWVIS